MAPQDVTEQLEQAQVELLVQMVDRVVNLPRTQQRPFILTQSMAGDVLIAPDRSNLKVLHSDLEALADAGLLRRGFGGQGSPNYTPTGLGRKVYEWVKTRTEDRLASIEAEVTGYLTGEAVLSRYEPAFAKWRQAEAMLWEADDHSPTQVGHLAREAMQDFAGVLVGRMQPPNAEELTSNPQQTVVRIRACLDAVRSRLGDREAKWLEALLAYWGTVSDLAQRQEHGAGKEGESLGWEDSRRLVFHTAIVMYELVRLDTRRVRPPRR